MSGFKLHISQVYFGLGIEGAVWQGIILANMEKKKIIIAKIRE